MAVAFAFARRGLPWHDFKMNKKRVAKWFLIGAAYPAALLAFEIVIGLACMGANEHELRCRVFTAGDNVLRSGVETIYLLRYLLLPNMPEFLMNGPLNMMSIVDAVFHGLIALVLGMCFGRFREPSQTRVINASNSWSGHGS
ncbi:MAG: hypothetical protein SGI86_18340 [Deltaproteobacteria bacterium]|nr:hypothetical protein [Deltaproteobacteria bacterium]